MKLTLALIFAASTLLAQSNTYVLRAARLFDGTSDALIEPGLIVVANGTIQSVGSRSVLLPGFIDAHTHLTSDFNPDYSGAALLGLKRPVSERAIRATANARKTLMAGFTTVRDLGSSDFIDIGLRNAIDEGVVPGPRMLVSVHALGSTGGHCDGGDGLRYGVLNHESRPEDGVINSPDEARYAVRFNIKYGADVIKTCASGGVLSPTDDVDAPQLSQAELDALVDEAHALRRTTAAHAHGAEAAKRAIRAGIDSIEHGTFLDDEAMRMMHDKGVLLCIRTATMRSSSC
jgi:imidazolonepropionase-like amidohydrolase